MPRKSMKQKPAKKLRPASTPTTPPTKRSASKAASSPSKKAKPTPKRSAKLREGSERRVRKTAPRRSAKAMLPEAVETPSPPPDSGPDAKLRQTSILAMAKSTATGWLHKKRSQVRKWSIKRNDRKCRAILDWKIQDARIQGRLSAVPVEESCIPGIGQMRAKALRSYGLQTAYDLQDPLKRMCLKEAPQISDKLAQQLKAWSDHLARQARDEPIDRTSLSYHARLRKLKRESLRVRAK